MRLIRSELALQTAVALATRPGLTLTEVAAAAKASASSAKRALEVLVADGYAIRDRRTYRLTAGELTGRMVALAEYLLAPREVIRICAQASGQVEFVGEDDRVLTVIFARGVDPLDESRFARRIAPHAERLEKSVDYIAHDNIRRQLAQEPASRRRLLQLRPVFGDSRASFPDRSQHGVATGRPLRRPHPRLHVPSGRALTRLRTRYGIRSARLFGSAVRSDFRADSDLVAELQRLIIFRAINRRCWTWKKTWSSSSTVMSTWSSNRWPSHA